MNEWATLRFQRKCESRSSQNFLATGHSMATLITNRCVFLRLRMSGPPGRRVRPPSSYGSMRTDSSSSDIIEVGVGEEEETAAAAAATFPAVSPPFRHETTASALGENR